MTGRTCWRSECALWIQKLLVPRRANIPGTENVWAWYDIGVRCMMQVLNVEGSGDVDYLTVVAEHLIHHTVGRHGTPWCTLCGIARA